MELGHGVQKPLFLSAHRCPEADLLPHHDSVPGCCPPHSEHTCAGQCETNYLDVSPTHRSDRDEEDEDEDEETVSNWSEEDLSLHFSPSVILQSEDDESDLESGFECVDVSMETLVGGKRGEGLKMVPKRQIQLKKKKDDRHMQKLQVRKESSEGGGANSEVCPPVRPDLLRRQHSLPASFHSTDADSYRVDRGINTGANQVPDGGGMLQRQRLQKSFSLDETKTKLASCIIKSILSKKMQVEKSTCGSSTQQKDAPVLPRFPPPAERNIREGPGGDTRTGVGVAKAPVHVVRDMRSLVKNTYSLSFSHKNKPTSFKVIGQEQSPPPTYQQAVGVALNNHTSKRTNQALPYSNSCRGHVAKVAASFSQSQGRSQSNLFSCPVTQQRRSSEPMIGNNTDDATWPSITGDRLEASQSERGRGRSPQVGAPNPSSFFIPTPPSILTQPPPTALDQSPVLGPSSQFIPCPPQQVLRPCFYPAQVLPIYPPTLQSHIGGVGYVSGPLKYIPTSVQPAAISHLLRNSEFAESTTNTSDQVWSSENHLSESSAARAQQEQEGAQKLQRHEGSEKHQNHEGPKTLLNHEGPKKHQNHEGSKKLLNPEGPKKHQNHEGSEKLLNHEGPKKLLNPQGPKKHQNHEGSEKQQNHERSKKHQNHEGPRKLLNPEGPKTLLNPEGPKKHQNHEGPKILQNPEEPKIHQNPDQHELQQEQKCNLNRVLPAQVANDFIIDIPGSASAPGTLLGGPANCHFMFDPTSGRFFYLNMPTIPQRKILMDPETGQYIQVFLPVLGSAQNSSMFPVHGSNPTPIIVNPTHSLLNPTPSVIPVMQLQPTISVFSHPRLPLPTMPHHLTSTHQDGGGLPF